MKLFDWNNFGTDDRYKVNSSESVSNVEAFSEETALPEGIDDNYFAELNGAINKKNASSAMSSNSAATNQGPLAQRASLASADSSTTSSLFKDYTMKKIDEEEEHLSDETAILSGGAFNKKQQEDKWLGLKVLGKLIYIAAAIIIIVNLIDSYNRDTTYRGTYTEPRNAKNAGEELFGYEYSVVDGVLRKTWEKYGTRVTFINEFDAHGNQTYSGLPDGEHK